MSVKYLKQALREKLAAGSTETNEDEMTRGKANVYPDPPGSKQNTAGGNVGYSEAAVEAAKQTREEMVERLFDSPKTTAASEQALVNSLFSEEAIRERSLPHSIMQRRGRDTSTVKQAEAETLTDKVRRVTGLR
jgi:hypothetical protein